MFLQSISPIPDGSVHGGLVRLSTLTISTYIKFYILILGFVLISGIMALTSLAMLMFPKHLKGKKLSHDEIVNKSKEEKLLLEKPPRLQGKLVKLLDSYCKICEDSMKICVSNTYNLYNTVYFWFQK